MSKPNYNKTKTACYLGFITQAIAANFAPLLFLKFHNDYHISLGNIAWISTCFFFTQLLIDLFCARFVDKIGYRICVVASEVCAAAGLVGLAFLPEILPDPFVGILCSVILYAVGSGLIEVLCSPIIEACPFENKEATMSLLHSFYCWGAVGTILISTLFFLLFGMDSWKWLAVLWALIPAINVYNFATCPIEHLVEEDEGMKISELFQKPLFWIAICLMICSGASELAMAQWASAYTEAALGLSKALGDLAGPLHVCSHNGNQPYHLRKIWGQNGSDEIYDSLRNPVCHLLSSCRSVSQSSHRTYRLHSVWFLRRNHVARSDQYFVPEIPCRWNCHVRTACHGR